MMAVVTMGNGGYDMLAWRRVRKPAPGPGEVLVEVLAAGMNNTEINTRVGWYSDTVSSDTASAALAEERVATQKADGGWDKPTPFPFIQGTDCCGRVASLGQGVVPGLLGQRVLVRACMRVRGFTDLETRWMGSDFDGAFAQFVVVPAADVFPVDCSWSDAELGSIPCAYGSAENMVHRAQVKAGDHVVVAGASGGVGSAAVQLCKRRGARVTAVAALAKQAEVLAFGADAVIDRGADPAVALGEQSADVVIDNVAGPAFGSLVKVLRRGGHYASSGAIGGPMVQFDMRAFYLRDLTFHGCTAWDEPVFPNLVSYITRGEIRPLVARCFPLDEIAAAQRLFMTKAHAGKFVLLPPRGA
jgi:NADPH:quinone reductase-like Zn-dependent oxidoreductase